MNAFLKCDICIRRILYNNEKNEVVHVLQHEWTWKHCAKGKKKKPDTKDHVHYDSIHVKYSEWEDV